MKYLNRHFFIAFFYTWAAIALTAKLVGFITVSWWLVAFPMLFFIVAGSLLLFVDHTKKLILYTIAGIVGLTVALLDWFEKEQNGW